VQYKYIKHYSTRGAQTHIFV